MEQKQTSHVRLDSQSHDLGEADAPLSVTYS